jgi:hypothetical protein
MKTNPSTIAVCAALAFMTLVSLVQQEAQGEQSTMLTQLAASDPSGEYRAIDLDRLTGPAHKTAPEILQSVVDQQTREGWTVVANTSDTVSHPAVWGKVHALPIRACRSSRCVGA